ncbi:Gfo/Idh/MocA family oxidoreductase, partial [candidate division KSB1 bacterium]|nr:Gfo/Idh/MocA family oxidoreductase [candidate division KSB1 bacterium]
MSQPFKLGIVGAGFIARFQAKAMLQVRGVEIAGVVSRTEASANSFAQMVKDSGLGECKAFKDVGEMAKHVDAVAIYSPNFTRLEIVEKIVEAVKQGAALKGLICEKPLARNVKEARRMVELVQSVRLPNAYFENQIFMKLIQAQLKQLAPQQRS